MTFEILNSLNGLENKLMGYTALLSYRYLNLCVKSTPVSLLSTKVIIDGKESNLEKVAKVAVPNDTQLYLVPIEKTLIPHICKAVLLEHPEFKHEIQDASASGDGSQQMIVLTVPPVDKDRKDAILDMVDALYKDCDVRMKAEYDLTAAKISVSSLPLPEESRKEAKEELKKLYDNFVNAANQTKEDKVKEVNDAYAHYCEEHKEEESRTMEDREAKGTDSVFKMTLDQ